MPYNVDSLIVVYNQTTNQMVMRTTLLNKARWLVALCPSKRLQITTYGNYKNRIARHKTYTLDHESRIGLYND